MHIRDQHSKGVRVYRWIVFLLAAGYVIRHLWFTADYSMAGGPFRFLTFWAMLLSFFSASRMLAITEYRTERDWSILVDITVVANALVVLLYWRLWFTDPSLVNATGGSAWYDEYYFHLLGPVLQWIDALFIFGAFRKPLAAIAGVFAFIVAYVAWIELFVGPLNNFPNGNVTSGLPYPFLNSMVLDDRVGFYVTTSVSGLVLFTVFWAATVSSRWFHHRRRD